MNFKKPEFNQLLSNGRSLVFVPGRSQGLALRSRINGTPLIQNYAWAVTPQSPLEYVLREIEKAPPNVGIILLHHTQAVGFRVQVDRVVWIGKQPLNENCPEWAYYWQAMARGDYPPIGYQAARCHYSEDEAGFNKSEWV